MSGKPTGLPEFTATFSSFKGFCIDVKNGGEAATYPASQPTDGFSLIFLNIMKRIGTVFLFAFFAFTLTAQAQITSSVPKLHAPAISVTSAVLPVNGTFGPSSPNNEDAPLSTRFDTVSYFGDTSNGNWWVYVPVLDQSSGDSLGYYGVSSDGTAYFQNEDTIGISEFKYINSSGATIDTFPIDTMYYRIMGLRFSTPHNITSPKLTNVTFSILPISFNATDELQVWFVPLSDQQFLDGNTYPIPSIFSTLASKVTIKSSAITVGQVNTITATFNKSLTTADLKNQFAVVVFVDGPNFITDTVGYLFDQNLQTALGTSLVIDTDGSIGATGEPMRTYKLNLDGGNMSIQGQTSFVGGGGGFFVDFAQLDPATGQQTGSAFEGNLLMSAHFSGTASGVDDNSTPQNTLAENFPNPVSTTTEINYNLAASGPVNLSMYNALGEKVGTIVNGIQGAGQHTANFNIGTLPDGMYYYKLQSGEFSATQTMVIAR